MKNLMVIAVIGQVTQVGKKPATVGYRIYDTSSNNYRDFSIHDKGGVQYCMANANNFLNVTPMAGATMSFKFINGQESRYPVIDVSTGTLIGGVNPLVIVKEYNDGYRIVDAFGRTFDWTNDTTLQYAQMQGIANGKQMTRNGKIIISSISGSYPHEDINITPKEEKVAKGVKGKPVQTRKFPKTFYQSLEPGFGGPASVAIVEYLFEERGLANDKLLALLKALNGKKEAKQVPAMMGLMTMADDTRSKKGTTDKQLVKLLHVVVEPEAIKFIYEISQKYGLYFDELWLTKVYAPPRYTKPTSSNIRITLNHVGNKLANYIMMTGKTMYGTSINEDASLVVYNGKTIEYESYMISGVFSDHITLSNGIGKTKKISSTAVSGTAAKEVAATKV